MPASPTPAQSAASRINGAKSRGPTTPAGKARAALNGLRPAARPLRRQLLQDEDPALLEALRRRGMQALVPEDAAERDAVAAMAQARHRLIRLDRLLDRVLAGDVSDVHPGAEGLEAIEALGRWRERAERDLDRAHRRFLRRRRVLRQGLVEFPGEPESLAREATMRGEPEPVPAPPPAPRKIAGEPETPPPAAAAGKRAHEPEPRPRPPAARYARMLRQGCGATVAAGLAPLGRRQREALLRGPAGGRAAAPRVAGAA